MDIYGKRILITCGGGVGDLVVFTPVLRALKEKYRCYITFLTPRNYEILSGLPYIDEIIFLKRGIFLGRYRCIHKLAKQDIIIFSDWEPQLLLMAFFLKVPYIAGVSREGHKFSNLLDKKILPDIYDSKKYMARIHADVIEDALGIDLEGEMENTDVAIPGKDDKATVDRMLAGMGIQPEDKYILLSPFTGLPEKNWSVEKARNFVTLAEKKYDLPIIVIGTGEYLEEARMISKRCLAGETTLLQLVELIKRAECLVASDSGPMHIAGAVGTPVVALFGLDLPLRWAPKHNCRSVYLNCKCSPCSYDEARQCKNKVECMRNISVEMVMKAMDDVVI